MVNKIGVSLPTAYLAGEPSPHFNAAFGPAADCLTALRETGVEAIELRTVNQATPVETTLKAAQTAWSHGLDVTVHGALPPLADIREDSQATTLLGIAALPQELDCVVTVHTYSGRDSSLIEHTQRTREMLAQLLRTLPRHIRIAVEINRDKGAGDPSTTYQGVVDIVSEFDPEAVGICWDFGHAAANIRNGLLEAQAPSDFVARVIHTHIHGLSDDGGTHYPLQPGDDGARGFGQALLATGYSGHFNLELNPERWPWPPAEKRDAVLASVAVLRSWLGQAPGSSKP